MTILPHHIAGGLLLGGLATGGYFAVRAVTPPSLENKVKDLGLELLTEGWIEKEADYKSSPELDLIPSIKKESDQTIKDFESKLKNWCDKSKAKSFEGEGHDNYKRFSRWCTKTTTIDALLKKRKLTYLENVEWENKFADYENASNTDKFLGETASAKKTKADLTNWCTDKKVEKYKYESDDNFKRVVKWCYKKAQ